MPRLGLALLITAVAAALVGCNMDHKAYAARDVALALEAARKGDRTTFEAHIHRPALRDDLREQLAALGRANSLDVGEASEFAIDRRINPQALRFVNLASGQPINQPITPAEVKGRIVIRGDKTLCLTDPSQKTCVLQFRYIARHWVLTSMPARQTTIAL